MTGLLHLQPTEYYDQRNADEERVGQVCMDDLASEGLLLIRMEPDDRGRYGFIVKVRNCDFRTSNIDDPVPYYVGRLTTSTDFSVTRKCRRETNFRTSNVDDLVPYHGAMPLDDPVQIFICMYDYPYQNYGCSYTDLFLYPIGWI